MKKISVKELHENVIEIIGKEWMLVTAGTKDRFNTMTASWGGVGFLWNKPVVFVFVRPERYTHDFMEENSCFTLSFLGEENKAIHKVCGSKSGRDIDKIKETGLKPIISENGNILFEQARMTIECRKLYTDELKEENFLDQSLPEQWYDSAHGGYHTVYVAEITDVWLKD